MYLKVLYSMVIDDDQLSLFLVIYMFVKKKDKKQNQRVLMANSWIEYFRNES